MRKLLFIFLIAISFQSFGQGNWTLSGTKNRWGNGVGLGLKDSASYTNGSDTNILSVTTGGRLMFKHTTYWNLFTTSADLNAYVLYTDTSSMLSPYLRKTDTSYMLSKYLRKTDTASMLSNRLKISDTATMLRNHATYAETLTGKTISGSSNTLTNIGNTSLTNSSITIVPGTNLTGGGTVSLGGTVTLSSTAGSGSVTNVSVVTANGVSGSVANPTTTPAITLTLGRITPTSVATADNLTVAGNSSLGALQAGTTTLGTTITGRLNVIGTSPQLVIDKTGGGSNGLQVNNDGGLQIIGNSTNPLIITTNGTINYQALPTLSVAGTVFLTVDNSTAANTISSRTAAQVRSDIGAGTGNGTVTNYSVVTANGVSASVTNPTTTPAATFTLGAITPSSVSTSGNITAVGVAVLGTYDGGAPNIQQSDYVLSVGVLASGRTNSIYADGQITSANGFNGTVRQAAQPNITSVGNLTGLSVTNNAQVGSDFSTGAGKLRVNFSDATNNGLVISESSSAAGSNLAIFYRQTTQIGSIARVNSTDAVTYNTTSDTTLKTNIKPSGDALSILNKIPIVEYDWKAGGHQPFGQGAQLTYNVFPSVVTKGRTKNGEYYPWQIDYQGQVPLIIKSIQQQQVIIESQQSQITDLKAQVAAIKAILQRNNIK